LKLKELEELKPNVMLVSEYRLLTPERSDNSFNSNEIKLPEVE